MKSPKNQHHISSAGHTTASNANVRSVVLGTAGHIDHGKTALVLALTGTDTDRLPEEKARGITIDLGFAAMELAGPNGQRFDVSLIDVPGHHAFIRNMLAGAGGIDAVMLVVAADEGVKAQTVEHLQICSLLGIRDGVLVLTKRDAVTPERLAAAEVEVRTLVKGSFLEKAPIVAVSALKREGLQELKSTLARMLASLPLRSAERAARMPVDRIFSAKGFGTVLTGTLQTGTVRVGQSLTLEPGSRTVRVRGIQVHGKARAEASAPNRVALNVAGVEVGEVHRGDTVVPEGTLEAVKVLDVELDLLPGMSVRHRQRVRVHAFASEALATALHFSTAEDGPALYGPLVRLRLDKAMLLLPGDRFVLRQPSPAMTLGGGRVLDAHPLSRLRKQTAAAWLEQLRDTTPEGELLLRIERRKESGLTRKQLLAETGWSAEALQRMLAGLLASGGITSSPGAPWLISSRALGSAEERLEREVVRAGAAGVPRAELRTRLRMTDQAFDLSLSRLLGSRKVIGTGDTLVGADQVPPSGERAPVSGSAQQVEAVYRSAGLGSPIVSEAAERLKMPATELRTHLTALLRAGKLVRLGSDALLVHADALQALVGQLQKIKGQTLDVGRFKTLTGLTRKHAIPLLEYLDGARVTRNSGGVRTVM